MDEPAALMVVDVQVDFCPGGALAIAEGDIIIPVINRYIQLFRQKGMPIFATRDWHPPVTTHFRQFGGVWPPHCVQWTAGAAFHPALSSLTTRLSCPKVWIPKKMITHRLRHDWDRAFPWMTS